MASVKLSRVAGGGGIETGRILESVATELEDGRPLLDANGLEVDAGTNPDLAALLNTTLKPISYVNTAVISGFSVQNGDGTKSLGAVSDGGGNLTVTLYNGATIVDAELTLGAIASSSGHWDSKVNMSRDGTKGFTTYWYDGSSDVDVVYMGTSTTLARRTLDSSYTSGNPRFSGCISADGTKSYIMMRRSGNSDYILYTSSDGFATSGSATKVIPEVHIEGDVVTMCTSSDGTYIYVLTGSRDILKSSDSGATFNSVFNVSEGGNGTSIECSDDGSHVIVSKSSATFISTDYGVTFTELNITSHSFNSELQIFGITFVPTTNTVVAIGYGTDFYSQTISRVLIKSYDSGVTWEEGVIILNSTDIYTGLVHSTYTQPLQITTDGSILRLHGGVYDIQTTLSEGKFLPNIKTKKIVGG